MNNLLQLFAATTINTVGTGDSGTDNQNLTGDLTGILNKIVGALAIVAVVVVIIGGVKYMTSNGDSTKVKGAKDTILYGCIGLLVCALAFAVVNFVIKNILGEA